MTFQVSTVDLINLFFITAGLGICALCFLQITASVHLQKVVRRYFQIFFTLILLYISAHFARELMNGIPGHGVRIALYGVTFAEVLAAGLVAHMMSMLILSVSKTGRSEKPVAVALLIFLCVHLVILIVALRLHLIFGYDEANLYHRAPGYLLSNLCPLLMLLTDVILLLRYHKSIDRRVLSAFWLYIIAPVIAIVVQGLVYGVQFIIFAIVVSAVYMFATIVHKQNADYEKQKLDSSRIESELNLATRIQADMLPNIYPAFPDRPEFDIYATMDPAKEVGGDFYDFFLVDDDHLCMVMADVSGKGVPAALFMMASKIILANNAMAGKSPAQILTDTNAAICSHNREEMFVTVWLGILEISTGKLTAANAGHEYPVLCKPNGKFEILNDKHGFVIGGMRGIKYKEYSLMLEPGAKLFLYTDGVPEATNADNQLFGTERMLEALNSNTEADPEQILNSVRAAVDHFVNRAEQFDDLTMLCMEYRNGADLC
ncbi:MAG: PP2C family protein-serine/threonine phosphatase [Clostridia bacterium]|nr:PP2C family protein-serine/threonine phosphatase [Clostridia bacterium]